MKIETAQEVAVIVAQLAVAVSQYQAQFGQDYRIVETSHPKAIRLYEAIENHQAHIAELLDIQALESAVETDYIWWKSLDVMDNASLDNLTKHIFHLIRCCAYPENQYNLTVIQSVIAGYIEPDIRYRVMHRLLDIQAIS